MKISPRVQSTLSIAFGLLFGLVGALFWFGLSGHKHAESMLNEEAKVQHEAALEKTRAAREAVAIALKEKTPLAWDKAAEAINTVSDEKTQKLLSAAVLLKRIEAYASARDKILDRAAEFGKYNPNDPRILEIIAEAKPFQEKVMELLKEGEVTGEDLLSGMTPDEERSYRASFLYQRGHAHYSRLWFIPGDNGTEINKAIEQSLASYARVFDYAPHDERTEYAIEALYEVNKERNNSSSSQGKKRPILAPQAPSTSSSSTPDQGI